MILLTGGYGFLGNRVYERLTSRGYRVTRFRSSEYDLTSPVNISSLFLKFKPSVVIHCAADVGGIEYNRQHGAKLLQKNLEMGMRVIQQCQSRGVEKLILIGSVCSYAGWIAVPIGEDQLWLGRPEESNAGYGLAKRMVCEMGINAHGNGLSVVNLILSNLYGPGDNYDLAKSHVVPAIVKKIIDAQRAGNAPTSFWGTGQATRDLLFVDDAVSAIVDSFEVYGGGPEPINIATGIETPIHSIVEAVAELAEYTGEISWDVSMPDGQARRAYDIKRAFRLLGWMPETPLADGLRQCVADYTARF
jgi:GDP-L-fucose synthase